MKTYDTYDPPRRLRFAPPNPTEKQKRIEIQPRDELIFSALDRHGPLPTHYLHALAGGNYVMLQARLRKLYDFGYLTRPSQYFDSFFARYQSIVYAHANPTIVRSDHAIHRLMCACVMASIELACKEVAFVSRSEIFAHPKTKSPVLSLPLGAKHQRNTLKPDELFALKGERIRFFAVEIDRRTEKLKSALNRKTIEDNFAAYYEILRNRTYADEWGIPNLRVLIVTTSEGRVETMKGLLDPQYASRFHFKVCKEFDSPWRMPPVYTDILEGLI